MGKQRTKNIRRIAREVFENFSDKISSDYGEVKAFLRDLNLPYSKHDLNIVAGVLVKKSKTKTQN